MKVSDALKAIRAKIEKPENWTQHVPVRDRDGNALNMTNDPRAACWCWIGAHWACGRADPAHMAITHKVENFINEFVDAQERDTGIMIRFNDTHTHDEVIAMTDKAIAHAEQLETEGML